MVSTKLTIRSTGPGNPWDRGLTIGEQRLRAAFPNAILVANSDRTMHGELLDGSASRASWTKPLVATPAPISKPTSQLGKR